MRTVLASVAALAAAFASAGSALAQEDGFPFAYTHAFGETVVPERPLRVLSLSTAGNGLAQVAGADLVGAYVTIVPTTWLEPYGPDTVLISNEVQLNFEQIAALEPDLILAIDTQRRFDLAESFATLNAIAPTVVPVEGERNDTYLIAAEALGARDAVEALIAQVDQRVATIRQSYADLGERTVAYGLASPGTFGIQVDPALASSVQLFAALGLPHLPRHPSSPRVTLPPLVTLGLDPRVHLCAAIQSIGMKKKKGPARVPFRLRKSADHAE